MKKVLMVILVVLFMGCSLITGTNHIKDSWHTNQDNTFIGFEFDEKFIITEITNGIRGTIVYDYYIDNDDIYVLLNNEYVKTYCVEGMTTKELKLYSYIDNDSILFLRD